MGKTWVLETHTKGTGANMVPLEGPDEPATGERKREPQFKVPTKRAVPAEPVARAPRRFRVVDVLTGRVLADDASTRQTVEALGGADHMVDVAVSVWSPADDRWRLLTLPEQRALWERRGAAAA